MYHNQKEEVHWKLFHRQTLNQTKNDLSYNFLNRYNEDHDDMF